MSNLAEFDATADSADDGPPTWPEDSADRARVTGSAPAVWTNDMVEANNRAAEELLAKAVPGTPVSAPAAHLEQSPRSFSTQPCGHCGATDRHYSGCYYAGQRVTVSADAARKFGEEFVKTFPGNAETVKVGP